MSSSSQDAAVAAPGVERRTALERVIAAMSTAVAADGGTLTLVDVDTAAGVVTVELSGACSSCALSSVTLEQGVERILRDRLTWVREVRYSVAEADWESSAALGRGSWRPSRD
jgi:Fe-S cluster biogenesis protein NfuA